MFMRGHSRRRRLPRSAWQGLTCQLACLGGEAAWEQHHRRHCIYLKTRYSCSNRHQHRQCHTGPLSSAGRAGRACRRRGKAPAATPTSLGQRQNGRPLPTQVLESERRRRHRPFGSMHLAGDVEIGARRTATAWHEPGRPGYTGAARDGDDGKGHDADAQHGGQPINARAGAWRRAAVEAAAETSPRPSTSTKAHTWLRACPNKIDGRRRSGASALGARWQAPGGPTALPPPPCTKPRLVSAGSRQHMSGLDVRGCAGSPAGPRRR